MNMTTEENINMTTATNVTENVAAANDNAVEKNYIDIIKNLRNSTVSKTEYDRVVNDNRMLADALANGKDISADNTPAVMSDEDIDAIRKDLQKTNSGMTNLEFITNALVLRDALIAKGERDPFLPNNPDYVETEADIARVQYVADGLKQIAAYCNGDADLFNSELKRCAK